jgi:plastocyanin
MSGTRAPRAPTAVLATLAGLALVAFSAWVLAAPARAAQNYTVDNADFAFVPAALAIAVGDTVTWTNSDPVPHTATADDGTFDSGAMDQGATYSFTFATAGEFAYTCLYHPEMAGTITVRAAAATASPGQGTAPDTAMSRRAMDPGWLVGLIGLGVLFWSLAALGERGWRRRQAKER